MLTDKVTTNEKLRWIFVSSPALCLPIFGSSSSLYRQFFQLIDRVASHQRIYQKRIRQFGLQVDNSEFPAHLVPSTSKIFLYANLALVTHSHAAREIFTHKELGLKYDPKFFDCNTTYPFPKAQHPRMIVGPSDDQLFQIGNAFVYNMPTKQLNNCTLSFIMIAFSVLLNPHYLEITGGRVGEKILNIFPIEWLYSTQGNTGKTFTIQLMKALMGVHIMVAAAGSISHSYQILTKQGGIAAVNMDDCPASKEVELNSMSRTIAQSARKTTLFSDPPTLTLYFPHRRHEWQDQYCWHGGVQPAHGQPERDRQLDAS